MGTQLTESFRAATRLDLGHLRVIVPIRLAVGVVIPLIIGVALGHTSLGVAAACGSFITAFADSGDTFPMRARFMLIAAFSVTATSLVGGLVSDNFWLILLTSMVVAAVCGYAGALGSHAALIGVLSLVLFNLFAGGKVSQEAAVMQAAAVLLGGLVQVALSISGWPFRRFSGVRGQAADAWRVLAVACRAQPRALLSPAVPSALLTAATGVATSGAKDETKTWLVGIVTDGDTVRLPLVAIAADRARLSERSEPSSREELAVLDDFTRAVGATAKAISRALVVPARRGGVAGTLAHLNSRAAAARKIAPRRVDAITAALHSAASRFEGPIPIGSRAKYDNPPLRPAPIRSRLRAQLTWSSPILRHSVRLAVATGAAWVIGVLVLTDHQYWLPLTVAWVTRPEYGGTVGRVVSRILGTLVGLIIVGLILYGYPPNVVSMLICVGVFSVFMYIAFPVNYALTVTMVTCLIVTLLQIAGSGLIESLTNRGLATLIAGILIIVAARIGPTYAAPGLATKLADLAIAMRGLADAVLSRKATLHEASAPVVSARTSAAAAVETAKIEPRQKGIDPLVAEKVLDAMIASLFEIAAWDSEGADTDQECDPVALDADLCCLEAELRHFSDPAVQIPKRPNPGTDAIRAPVDRALRYLELADKSR